MPKICEIVTIVFSSFSFSFSQNPRDQESLENAGPDAGPDDGPDDGANGRTDSMGPSPSHSDEEFGEDWAEHVDYEDGNEDDYDGWNSEGLWIGDRASDPDVS